MFDCKEIVMKAMQMTVVVCVFKRKKYSKWEYGLAIGENVDEAMFIVDREFNCLCYEDIWGYKMHYADGCIKFDVR